MADIPYFSNHSWSELTREERFYCFALYELAKTNPRDFALWVAERAGLEIKREGDWDLGVEVCFYRDYLWHKDKGGNSARAIGFPSKRTFDLCLFGRNTIIIIEAKVFEGFDVAQTEEFAKDREYIEGLPGINDPNVILVALASSHYYEALHKRGNEKILDVFDGKISWQDTFNKFKDERLLRAEALYKSKARRMLL